MSKITIGKTWKPCYNCAYKKVVSGKVVLLERYQVKRCLKSDRDTMVCLAVQTELNRLFVIKRLRAGSEADERFYWETQILKHLKHSHIPLLYDIQKDAEYNYIVEEYVEGESLKSVVLRRTLSISTAIRYAIQLCDILEYLHNHSSGEILYLDCQPDNIILFKDELFLIDFGNSVYAKDYAGRHYRYGTIGYAAPELYERHTATPATDVYGVGALLYYMLIGELPLTGKEPGINKIPKQLGNVIRKCMRHNPGQRYNSVKEVSDALKKISLKSINKKTKEITNLVISIAGVDRRVGVTHLGMSLAKYLERKGYYCLFTEQIVPGILMKLLECRKEERGLFVKEGVFWYKGVGMLPFYGNIVEPEIEKIKKRSKKPLVLIKDFGCFCDEISEEYFKSDIYLLVGDGKPWEFNTFCKKIDLMRSEKAVFIVSFISGRMFYKLTGKTEHSFIRMPYYSKWWAPGRVGNNFLEQITCEILKKRER